MAEKLVSGTQGSDIETKTESRLLLDFIKDNWNLTGTAVSTIDFGAHPSRTKKGITINTYRIISNVRDEDVGSHAFAFDVPVAIDVYVRDIKAEGLKDEPAPKLIAIDNYLRQFISINRLGLRSKGVNSMMISQIEHPDEPSRSIEGEQKVWYHLVTTVRLYYHMFRVPA